MKRIMASLLFFLVLSMTAGCAAGTTEDDHGHEHGDLPYEWSGELMFEPGTYEMVFQESGDPAMDIAFVILDGSINDVEHHAHHILEADMVLVGAGDSFSALPDYGYTLGLNPDHTTFTFHIEEGGRYSLFTEHKPEEFDLAFFNEAGELLVPENQQEY